MKRGKRISAVATVLGIVVSVIVVITSWQKIVETYYAHVLESGEKGERLSAIEGLAQLDRPSSVPVLLETFLSDQSNDVRHAALHALSMMRLSRDAERVLESIAAELRKSASGVLSSFEVGEEMLEVSVTRPESEFLVSIDFSHHVPWGAVVSVIDACKRFEIKNITLEGLDSGRMKKVQVQSR